MRVLLVEDDPDTAEAVAMGLRREGFRVSLAKTGTRAMCYFWRYVDRGTPFPVAILDCALPGLDGWSVAANIRRAERAVHGLRRAYLVGYTGYGAEAEELVADGDRTQFDRVIYKGSAWDELMGALRKAREEAECGE